MKKNTIYFYDKEIEKKTLAICHYLRSLFVRKELVDDEILKSMSKYIVVTLWRRIT